MIRATFLLAGLALASVAHAQDGYAIAGRVVEAETGAPVEAASVAVWRVSARAGVEPFLETGGVSDASGAFRIGGLSRGRYYVVASFVGTEPARSDTIRLSPRAPLAEVGDLALAADPAALDAVEVLAERDRVRFEVDRTVYQISDDPLLAGASTSEALETIPSVEIDVDGNVALRGNANVVVLIDGRPAPVGRDFVGVYLQSLPADAVERVEVVPNPSAAYRPDGSAGVLNIVLRKDTRLGLGGALTAGVDTQGGANGSALLSASRGPLRLTATAALRTSTRETDGDRFRINRFLGDAATEITQLTASERDRRSALLNLAADWTATPRTTVTASLNGSLRDGAEADRTATLEALGGRTLSDVVRVGDGSDDGRSVGLRLGLRHDFEGTSTESAPERRRRGGRGGGRGRRGGGSRVSLGEHALAVDLRATLSDADDGIAYTEDGIVDQRTTQDGASMRLALQADYARPIGDTRLELGWLSELDADDDDFRVESLGADGVLAPDRALSTAYALDEVAHAAYVQLARQLGPVAVQAGVRGEAARRTFTLGGEDFVVDYQSLFPSASLALDLADATVLRASYSRRIDRPGGRRLNPFPSTDDPLNVRVGNPELRPEYTDAVEVGVVRQTAWGSLTVSPYLRRTTDVVRRFQTVDDRGVTTTTYRNLDSATSTGVESVVSYQGGGSLRGFLSVEGYRRTSDGANVEAGLASDAFGWGGRLNATWAVGDRLGLGDLSLQSTVFYTAARETEQGRVGERVFFDVGLRQRLFDGRGSLALRARDPFGWAGIEFVQDDARLFQSVSRSFGRSQVGVTFTYAFGRADEQPDRVRAAAPDEGDGGGLDF